MIYDDEYDREFTNIHRNHYIYIYIYIYIIITFGIGKLVELAQK